MPDHAHPHAPPPGRTRSDDWQLRLREKGYRLTPQRELVLAAVERLGHATPDEVLAEVRKESQGLNISTVYRSLELLEELGLVRHAHLHDRAPTYHSTSEGEHFHLVCRSCQRVVSVDRAVAAVLTDRLERDHGFVTDVGHLTVHGLCADCAASEAAGAT